MNTNSLAEHYTTKIAKMEESIGEDKLNSLLKKHFKDLQIDKGAKEEDKRKNLDVIYKEVEKQGYLFQVIPNSHEPEVEVGLKDGVITINGTQKSNMKVRLLKIVDEV